MDLFRVREKHAPQTECGPVQRMSVVAPKCDLVSSYELGNFIGSKITADSDCHHEIKKCFFLGRKAMTNLDSVSKSRDIPLPTKVCLVKVMVFPVVMYGCEMDHGGWAPKNRCF